MRPVQLFRNRTTVPTEPPPPPPPPTETEWSTRKVIIGCVDRKGIPNNRQIKNLSGSLITIDPSPADANLVRGAVYTDSWTQYENTQGTKVFTGTTFMNTAQTKGLAVRVRPELGLRAPTWAKQLLGGPIQMYDHGTSTGGEVTPFTVGYLWEDAYFDAAQSLFEWLGTTLSAWESFYELSLSHAMTFYQEPMIWQLAFAGEKNPDGSWLYKPNTILLWETNIDNPSHGYSYEKHIGSYEKTIDVAKTLLVGTHAKNFVFNSPLQFIQNTTPSNPENARMGTSEAACNTLIDRAAATDEMVLMNHSMRLWPLNSTYDKMYKKFASSGVPCAYQTINTVNKWWNQNPDATMFKIVEKAVFDYNAFSVELAGTSTTYLSQERSGSIAQAAGQSKLQLNVEQIEYLNAGMQANYDAFIASRAA